MSSPSSLNNNRIVVRVWTTTTTTCKYDKHGAEPAEPAEPGAARSAAGGEWLTSSGALIRANVFCAACARRACCVLRRTFVVEYGNLRGLVYILGN